jgi:hypothetical protein
VIRKLLLNHGTVGDHTLNEDWPIFVSIEPEEVNGKRIDDIITIYNTVGKEDGRHQIDGSRAEHPGIQVLIRCADSERGLVKARELERILNEEVLRENVELYDSNDVLYTYFVQALTQTSLILPLGRDQDNSDRFLFTINYTVTMSLESTGTGT